jgi:hypothetical protein
MWSNALSLFHSMYLWRMGCARGGIYNATVLHGTSCLDSQAPLCACKCAVATCGRQRIIIILFSADAFPFSRPLYCRYVFLPLCSSAGKVTMIFGRELCSRLDPLQSSLCSVCCSLTQQIIIMPACERVSFILGLAWKICIKSPFSRCNLHGAFYTSAKKMGNLAVILKSWAAVAVGEKI